MHCVHACTVCIACMYRIVAYCDGMYCDDCALLCSCMHRMYAFVHSFVDVVLACFCGHVLSLFLSPLARYSYHSPFPSACSVGVDQIFCGIVFFVDLLCGFSLALSFSPSLSFSLPSLSLSLSTPLSPSPRLPLIGVKHRERVGSEIANETEGDRDGQRE